MSASLASQQQGGDGLRKLILRLRREKGFAQETLARLIGCSRSILAMVETGHRRLPTQAAIRLLELAKQTHAASKADKPAATQTLLQAQRAHLLQQLRKEAQQLRGRRIALEQRLNRLQAAYRENCQRHEAICHMLAVQQNENKDEKQELGLRLELDRCKAALKRCALGRQAGLQLKLEGLKGQLRWLRQKIEDLKQEQEGDAG